MARAGQQVRAGAGVRLADRIGIGVLTAAFPPDVVDAAVDEWDAREQRVRQLPARVMAYYVLAMVLFFDSGYSEVWSKLLSGLGWAKTWRQRRRAGMQPSTAAIAKARARLGWEPLAEMLRLSMVPAQSGPEAAPWAYWRGLRKLAIDGFTMNVQPTGKNDAFGRPANEKGDGAFPQVRVVALAETGSRALQGAHAGPLAEGEQTMARKLWPLLREGDLVVADRLFLSYEDLAAVAATGAHAIFRVKAGVDLPVLEVLADGSYRSRIAEPEQARRLRRNKTPAAEIPGIAVRIIEYTVAADAQDSEAGEPGELFCLATTLLDPETYPLAEFPDRYAERWRLETAIGDVETRLRGGPEVVLRSKSPDMVYQEVYAMLCVCQAIRHLIATAADQTGLDPGRISFTRTAQAARRHASDEAALSPL